MENSLLNYDVLYFCWQLSLSSCAVAADILSRSVSAISHLLRSSGADIYGLVPLSAKASSNILQAVTSPTVDVRRHRQFVKKLIASLSSSMDHLLQVTFDDLC